MPIHTNTHAHMINLCAVRVSVSGEDVPARELVLAHGAVQFSWSGQHLAAPRHWACYGLLHGQLLLWRLFVQQRWDPVTSTSWDYLKMMFYVLLYHIEYRTQPDIPPKTSWGKKKKKKKDILPYQHLTVFGIHRALLVYSGVSLV